MKLRTGQVDRIPELAALVGAGEFEGVPGTEIERLGVILTKYFALLPTDGVRPAEAVEP